MGPTSITRYTGNYMDDKAIRSQLEALLRAEDNAFVAARKKQQEEMAALSDEEWWQRLVDQTNGIRPEMIEVFERSKVEMIAGRHKPAKQEVEFREKMIQRKTLELLPYVMELRIEEEATGNLTKDQLHIASIRLTGESSKSLLNQLEGVVDRIENPKKKEWAVECLKVAKQDRADLDTLHDPENLTEERVDEVVKIMLDRGNQLLDWMRSPDSKN